MVKIRNNFIPEAGDIIWMSLSPTRGHEQSGRRPVLVLTEKTYNMITNCAIVCPMTTQVKGYTNEVVSKLFGKNSVILSDQLRHIDFSTRNIDFITKASVGNIQEVKEKIKGLLLLNG